MPAVQWDLQTRSGWKPWAASPARTARGIARHVLAQRPKLASETLIPQEWLNLALRDATAAAGLEDLAMHSWPGKMRGLKYQLAILTDVVETPSDASDHGSFPVASAWPKLTLAALEEAAGSKVPALGYNVPYAVGNTLLTLAGPLLVALIP